MAGAKIAGARGKGAIFMKTGLQKADLSKVNLAASHFLWVDAAEAQFVRANLPGARFDHAILREASFERANLFGADFRKAVITRTSFKKASLVEAKLTETAGTGVEMDGAKTKGMNTQRTKATTSRGGSL
jgi:uncharacterized protein YjbI with pentapeptide repeats